MWRWHAAAGGVIAHAPTTALLPAAARRDLITDQMRRSSNQHSLLEALRLVNQMIQRGAKLRLGAAKVGVVAACRAALKANNPQALMSIIRSGAM